MVPGNRAHESVIIWRVGAKSGIARRHPTVLLIYENERHRTPKCRAWVISANPPTGRVGRAGGQAIGRKPIEELQKVARRDNR